MSFLFEQQLAHHCSPALAGIKPANLFSCLKKNFPAFEAILREYQTAFSGTDIRFCVLCECPKRYLLLVYREKPLMQQVSLPLVQQLLSQDGYPACADIPQLLQHLQRRFSNSSDFPHEIGLFLGYPPEDVIAFEQYKGQNFQLCGYWKVYTNPQSAKQLFYRYDRCREAVCRRLEQGATITKMFGVA